jgi:hypothetical protein
VEGARPRLLTNVIGNRAIATGDIAECIGQSVREWAYVGTEWSFEMMSAGAHEATPRAPSTAQFKSAVADLNHH